VSVQAWSTDTCMYRMTMAITTGPLLQPAVGKYKMCQIPSQHRLEPSLVWPQPEQLPAHVAMACKPAQCKMDTFKHIIPQYIIQQFAGKKNEKKKKTGI